MEDNKILNALSYFSVIFAPFIVPLIIWIVGKDPEVKYHAKRSLLSHIIPIVLIAATFIIFLISSFTTSMTGDTIFTSFIIGFIICAIIYLVIFIWNIVQGIKALVK